jgi:hypothetical protein
MSFSSITCNDFHLEASLFQKNCEGTDHCSQCREKRRIVSCNKCGDAVCQDTRCSQLFPHYHDTIYAICKECTYGISNKLKLVIDMSKLKLLKNKIKKRQTKYSC